MPDSELSSVHLHTRLLFIRRAIAPASTMISLAFALSAGARLDEDGAQGYRVTQATYTGSG